jgi:hypothetical protein
VLSSISGLAVINAVLGSLNSAWCNRIDPDIRGKFIGQNASHLFHAGFGGTVCGEAAVHHPCQRRRDIDDGGLLYSPQQGQRQMRQ